MSQLLTPTIIIEKTHLGKVVSLLKGLERCFDENEKSIFLHRQIESHSGPLIFLEETVMNQICLCEKIDFSFSASKQRSSPFRSETTLPRCVFSIIILGVKSWLILKKSIFLIFFQFSSTSRALQKGSFWSIGVWKLFSFDEKNLKMSFYHLQSLGSCRLASQLSANIIWASSGCLKLQKLDFSKKIVQKGVST